MDLIFLPVYPRGIEWFKTKTKNRRKCHNSKRNMCEYKYRKKDSVWDKIFYGSLFLWIFDFFVFFGKLIFAIRTERFFLAGYICIHVCSLQRAPMKWIDNIKDTILISPVL